MYDYDGFTLYFQNICLVTHFVSLFYYFTSYQGESLRLTTGVPQFGP